MSVLLIFLRDIHFFLFARVVTEIIHLMVIDKDEVKLFIGFSRIYLCRGESCHRCYIFKVRRPEIIKFSHIIFNFNPK